MEKDEDLLMEDAILYVQKQRYREGLSIRMKRELSEGRPQDLH